MDKKMLLIINPVAGRKLIQKMILPVVRRFMDAGYLVSLCVTGKKKEATELVRQHGAGVDLIVAAGGDGTLNEAVAGIIYEGLDVPVGYLPCGTVNVFAAAQGIPTEILAAAEAVAGGTVRSVDLGSFNDRFFTTSASFGAFTRASYSTDQELKNHLGYGAYILDSANDLSKLRTWPVRMELDGTPLEGEYIFGSISNTQSIVGVIHFPPALVDVCDGKFEVLLVKKPQTLTDWQQIIYALLSKDYNSSPLITLRQASHILVDNPEDLIWSLDGEGSEPSGRIEIQALPGALHLQL